MIRENFLFTSESVTEGHPDKIADQISDAVLDEIIKGDPDCRVACEAMVTTGIAFVAGEITTSCYVEIPDIVRETIKGIGYTRAKYGYDYETCAVLTSIHNQSPDIAMGVDPGGAGDQGLMFGYATNETAELMPMPIMLVHKLTQKLTAVRKEDVLPYLRPDGKSQVTIEYRDGKPVRVSTVVISTQHSPDISLRELREDIIEKVVKPVLPPSMVDEESLIYHINPTGRFVIGGPQGDAGLTGRKIIVDTYGGAAAHGGGAFSGKDTTKVDRSAAYAARYLAKNVVAAKLAERCTIQLSYAIGVAQPLSIYVNTHGTGILEDEAIEQALSQVMDLSPGGIRKKLDLNRPIYAKTAAYGHFGRKPGRGGTFSWEKTDLVDALKKLV